MRAIRAYYNLKSYNPITSPHMESALDEREWIDPRDANATTSFMLIELPLMCNCSQACIDFTYDLHGKPSVKPLLYIFTGEGVSIRAKRLEKGAMIQLISGLDKPDHVPTAFALYDPAPRWLELLIGIAKEMYAPYLEADNLKDALRNHLLYTDLGPSMVPKLEPNPQQRQKMAVCVLWPNWELEKLSWGERAEQLSREGLALNKTDGFKNMKALQKYCARLQLKMGDKFT